MLAKLIEHLRTALLNLLTPKSSVQPSEDEYITWAEEEARQKLGRTHVICENCWHEVQVFPYTHYDIPSYEPPQETDPAILAQLQRKNEFKDFLHVDDSRELPTVPGDFARMARKAYPTGKLPPINLNNR